MKRHKYLIFICVIAIYVLFSIKIYPEPIENLIILSGVGYDIQKLSNGDIRYAIPISQYVFQENKVASKIVSQYDYTIGKSREKRQLKSNKKLIVGLQKVIILGEEASKYGIKYFVNILFSNSTVNPSSLSVVSKEKTEDVLKFKVEGYPSSSDYIQGLLKSLKYHNFFSKEFELVDVVKKTTLEGECLVLPYIQIKNNELVVTGEAVFHKDKMVAKLDMEDSRALNILREKESNGIITIQESVNKYLEYYASVNRKVKCSKVDDKYKFTIELKLYGDVISNQLYENLKDDPNLQKKVTAEIEKKVEEMTNKFIEKMKNKYKMDFLELGRIASAKYGTKGCVYWDKDVTEAQIEVKVSAKIKNSGRGDY